MATVAILSKIIPPPKNAPGSRKLYFRGREWAKKHKLILICHCKKAELDPSVAALYSAIEFLPVFPPPSLWGRIRHRVHNAVFFSQRYRNPRFLKQVKDRLAELMEKHQASHLYVAQLNGSELIPDSLRADQVTVNINDDLSLLYLREADLCPSALKRFKLRREADSIGRYLKQLNRRNYAQFVVGEDDQKHLADSWQVRSSLVPLGVDTEFYTPDPTVPRQLRAVFTGVMSYQPNVETAGYFAESIFPLLRQQFPELEFYIVGANPCPEVLRLSDIPGVHVTGTVPDIRPYLRSAAVFVSPMRSGAGIKNKILETMSVEIPVVASKLGVAGIAVEDGVHCFLSEVPQDFADKVARVLKGGEDIRRMTQAAKEFVVANHSWAVSAESISSHWR